MKKKKTWNRQKKKIKVRIIYIMKLKEKWKREWNKQLIHIRIEH